MTVMAVLSCSTREDYTSYVNPNIGTAHSRWFFYTPASEPFGMAKLGASTNGTYGNKDGWEAVGYEDSHTSIDGFPCFHEFQVGGVALMPVTGDIVTYPGRLETPEDGWRSVFDKSSEKAAPGYYSVVLDRYGTKVELTATTRVGFQRFSFLKDSDAHILFNIGNRQGESGAVRDAYVKADGNTVSGYVVTEPEYTKKYQEGASVSMYFYAVLDKEPESFSVFHQGSDVSAGNEIKGRGAVLSADFSARAGESVTVKIGLSFTSVDNAKLNLETEAAAKGFDKAHREATALWNRELGKLKVSGGKEGDKVKFYTGLYHVLLGRGVASDVNGAYPKNDGSVGQSALKADGTPESYLYNTDAVWGAYWNLTPLWALAYPEYYNNFVKSQLLVYDDAGWLGDGLACSKHVSGVGTNMVSVAIAGAYNSGICGFDVDKAFEASLKDAVVSDGRIEGAGKMDVAQFVEKSYVPYITDPGFVANSRGATFSVSHTLEYAFSAYAVAQMAKSLGHKAEYERLMQLSEGWGNVFDDSLKLVRPVLEDGEFISDFDPYESWRGFQEGNAMQYTFYVPQDPRGLAERMGVDEFNERLDTIFTQARKTIFGGGKDLYAFSGLRSPYNHGNQPSLHIPWLFNFSGRPDLTQKWARLICDEFYGYDGQHGYGYGQDEDQGQLGAWYVLSSMGLFDVQGGACSEPTYQIGSPVFDEVEISLSPFNAKGRKFVIKAVDNAPESYYIQKAELNGEPLERCWLYRSEVYAGGELVLYMGPEPSDFGSSSVPPVSR